jgi:hypothetical protein
LAEIFFAFFLHFSQFNRILDLTVEGSFSRLKPLDSELARLSTCGAQEKRPLDLGRLPEQEKPSAYIRKYK